MWIYLQSTGELYSSLIPGVIQGKGYSGFGEGKNNPLKQNEKNIGPIPVGSYTIGEVEYLREIGPHGPYVLPLKPYEDNEMFDREGFLIHGDSISHLGSASHGCIILPYVVRLKIGNSPDKKLVVISNIEGGNVQSATA